MEIPIEVIFSAAYVNTHMHLYTRTHTYCTHVLKCDVVKIHIGNKYVYIKGEYRSLFSNNLSLMQVGLGFHGIGMILVVNMTEITNSKQFVFGKCSPDN